MEDRNMECRIVEDLLPLYAEGMCSDESKKYVEEHTADCASCREKLECYKEDVEQILVPGSDEEKTIEEIRPMRKVNRKLRKKRCINVILSIVLVLCAGLAGLLSYGQLFPGSGAPSFEVLFERIKIRGICEELCSGNPEVLTDYKDYSLYPNSALLGTDYAQTYFSSIEDMLETAFQENFGEKKLKIKDLDTYYVNESVWDEKEQYYVCSEVLIEADGEELWFSFDKTGDGIYRMYCSSTSEKSQYDEFIELFNYIMGDQGSYQQLFVENWVSGISRYAQSGEESSVEFCIERLSTLFVPDAVKASKDTENYQQALRSRLDGLNEKGIVVKACYGRKSSFDEESGKETQQLAFVFEKMETGEKVTLLQNFYLGPQGYEAFGEGEVISGTLSEEEGNVYTTLFETGK